MPERIDAHQHLWRYVKAEYEWINEEMGILARNYLPEDLREELLASGIHGSVAVQARQTLDETSWLLQLADEFDFIRGVVGWVPLASAGLSAVLDCLQGSEKLKGVRHVIQDEPDDEFMLRADFNAGVALLKDYGLVYDILIFERQLPAAISFVNRHPEQIFVLDHIAKPRIRARELEPWRTNIRELARRENVYCKVSGMVTEADRKNWCAGDLQPYFDVVLQAFGPKRLMAGSDWPVCLLATTYPAWFCAVEEFVKPLSLSESEMILGGVASAVYSLASGSSANRKG